MYIRCPNLMATKTLAAFLLNQKSTSHVTCYFVNSPNFFLNCDEAFHSFYESQFHSRTEAKVSYNGLQKNSSVSQF